MTGFVRYQLVQPETLGGCSGYHRTMPWVHGEGVSPSWTLILSFLGPSAFPLPILFTVASEWLSASCARSVADLHLRQSERKRGPQGEGLARLAHFNSLCCRLSRGNIPPAAKLPVSLRKGSRLRAAFSLALFTGDF